jgi:hypothetical protein
MLSPKINGFLFLKISLNLELIKHPFYKKHEPQLQQFFFKKPLT